uniref:tRNA (adenosine(37)-N6)-threonylcarbamoyltransferase complex dimerization subunit type 1 TsaB n=1 Tax=Flavobacterium sp. TaxID=239 RepID=UPI00404B1AB6
MSFILNIETATKNCSVSLSENGKLIAFEEEADAQYSHAEKLHVFIEKVITESGISYQDLNAIAVSKGPGSYTGLRIGVSAAKGLAYALNIPLISVDTLLIMAKSVQAEPNSLIIPMIDARRMEVFTATFDSEFNLIEPVRSLILTQESFEHLDQKMIFIGDCQDKVAGVLNPENKYFLADKQYPSAKEMIDLSFNSFLNEKFEDVAYFEPFYLKDFFLG